MRCGRSSTATGYTVLSVEQAPYEKRACSPFCTGKHGTGRAASARCSTDRQVTTEMQKQKEPAAQAVGAPLPALRCPAAETAAPCCPIFPGIEILYDDVHAQKMSGAAVVRRQYSEITHCCEGRIERSFPRRILLSLPGRPLDRAGRRTGRRRVFPACALPRHPHPHRPRPRAPLPLLLSRRRRGQPAGDSPGSSAAAAAASSPAPTRASRTSSPSCTTCPTASARAISRSKSSSCCCF